MTIKINSNFLYGTTNLLGQRMNRRIDLNLINAKGLPINIIVNSPQVEKAMRASKGRFYFNSIKGLSYKVQIAEIKQNYNSNLIMDYPDAMVESTGDSKYYRYTVGLYQTFDSAEYLRVELQRKGVTTAEVIPYINGIRLGEEESKSQSASYPDLLNFIDSASQD